MGRMRTAPPPAKGSNPFGGDKAPPPYTPPSKGVASSVDAALQALAKKYPYYGKLGILPLIKNAADQWGVDPVELLATIIFEGGKANDPTPNSAGAVGLAQIADTSVDASLNPTRYHEFIQQYGGFSPTNTSWAVNYMAWRMGGSRNKYGSLDDWYRGQGGGKTPRGYNPGFTGDSRGPGPSAIISNTGGSAKKYVPTIPQTPTQTGGKSGTTSGQTQNSTDPYMVVSKGADGKVKIGHKFADTPPKNAITFDGAPMHASDWNSLSRQLDNYFVSYTGGRASASMLYNYVKKGWSTYQLTNALSQNDKKFPNSPIYKAQAPALKEAAKDLLPPGQQLSQKLIRQAVVYSWSPADLQAVLRAGPNYVQSNEFKQNTTTLFNVHQSIMGVPDTKALNGLKQAALAGWSSDQYAAYLRSSPQYTSSPEYQSKTLSFLTSLGLITGKQPILRTDVAPATNTTPNTAGPLPNDPRLKGPTGLSNPEDTVATYGP